MRVLFALTYFLFILVHNVGGTCLFPAELTGTWYFSNKGSLTINSTSTTSSIASYPTTTFGNIDLSCDLNEGSYYIFKSSSYTYLGLTFETFVCFQLSYRSSSSKYIFYGGSVENSDASNERLKSYLQQLNTVTTVAGICDRTTWDAGTEHVLLKNDGNEAASKVEFPFEFLGVFSYVHNSSGTTSCGSGSGAYMCASPDKSTMSFNYTACSTIQAYSATGVVYLMFYSTSAGTYYFTVYNTDTTVDGSTTYSFTCYVMSKGGTTLSATQYPQQCLSSQTPTSVASPGASLTFSLLDSCPYDSSNSVLSTASAAGLAIGLLLLIIIIVCAVLIWRYYKKRREREALDKYPLQKPQPANKRLTNGDLFRDGKIRDTKTPLKNGDVKINMDTDPDIRRENSICIYMTSRQGSGMGDLELKGGLATVEEPDKVNYVGDDVIEESENEAALASTFLPISPEESNVLHFTDEEIKEIERKHEEEEARKNDQTEDEYEDEFDMDDIDDELGLPRLSRAFTPVMPAPDEMVSLPTVTYKKLQGSSDSESAEERTATGVLKVKLKRKKRKKRIRSAKGNVKGNRPKSSMRETPFLERIKKLEREKSDMEQRGKLEKELKQIENEVIKARVTPATNKSKRESAIDTLQLQKSDQTAGPATPGGKYVVDPKRDRHFRSTNKGAIKSAGDDSRRRFGDPPSENIRANRKKTPRIRHPMEIHGDSEELPSKKENFKKEEEFWKDEKRARSGRRREHPEALTIPSVKEDPFDHRDGDRPTTTPTIAQARSGKSAFGVRSEHSASFVAPPDDPNESTEKGSVWDKVSTMWHFKNQQNWGH